MRSPAPFWMTDGGYKVISDHFDQYGNNPPGHRAHLGTDWSNYVNGQDIGTPFTGPIVFNGWDDIYGWSSIQRIEELNGTGGSNWYALFAHQSQQAPDGYGVWRARFDTLGSAGSTGRSSGVHLHMGVARADDSVTPSKISNELVPLSDPAPIVAAALAGAQWDSPWGPVWVNPDEGSTLGPKQRKSDSVVNIRPEPLTSAEILGVFPTGGVLDVEAYVLGENVEGNDVWFYRDGQFFWSGGFEDTGTHDLPKMAWPPEPEPDPYEGIPERLDAIDQAVIEIRKLIKE